MRGSIRGILIPVVVFAAGLSGCTDEDAVFSNRDLFDDPPAAAEGFLGYDEIGEKLTVCGNCHVSTQAGWEQTEHANAWAALQNSGHAQEFCEGCHTVGPLGNATDGAVGFAGTGDARYHDVQCESCHGPGLNHVNNPDGVQPLASIKVALDPAEGCAECHQGTHHPFVEEWIESAHAEASTVVRIIAGNNPSLSFCLDCHSAQGALKAFGEEASYLEANDPVSEYPGVVCAVCHDPHAKTHEAQLRFPLDSRDVDNNLCGRCHQRLANPDLDDDVLQAPHSPEGPLVLGTAGWWPPGFQPSGDPIVSTHGSTANPKLCATCHVSAFSVTDDETGEFVLNATGHLFVAVPCLDEEGRPTTDSNCASTERSFAPCVQCHSSENDARVLWEGYTQFIDAKVDEIDRLLTLVPPGEFNRSDGRFTTADGAWFNARLGASTGSPVHNPVLIRALLDSSIVALENEYGVTSALPPGE